MPDGGSFITYFYTVRYLRFGQVCNHVARRIGKKSKETKKSQRIRQPAEREIRVRQGVHLQPSLPRRLSLGGEWEFRFINIIQSFPPGEVDWRSTDKPKLWRYNLHYFDCLRDEGRRPDSCIRLLDHWIALNPPGAPDAWEPFPVSLRVVNWIKFFNKRENRGSLKPGWLESLYSQILWLEDNIESHLLANHYFKNAKALIFGGLFFGGDDAGRWLKRGLHILSAELDEQVLPDGGHFERSPMYHAMALEDCLDLYNLCRGQDAPALRSLSQRLRTKARDMVHFLLGMTHPDGRIALFNDAAFGIEAEPAELAGYYEALCGERAAATEATMWSFPDTGYYVMAPEPGTRMIIDCGPVGPQYQPGHSHSDILSFELSLKGRRVIVDSGCFQYEDGETRRYNRGGAGHNSVTIDGRDQSEVWGAHRCARRANPLYGRLDERGGGTLFFEGAHDGYRRLPGKPVHHRAVTWTGKSLMIEDRIEGGGRHELQSRLHIHPDLSVEISDEARVAIVRHDTDVLATIVRQDGGSIFRTDGWYCPEFGIKRTCLVLAYTCKDTPLPFRGGWIIKLN
ncbi:MAG: alginate lyase family protein [Nitrospiraceae bacterium]|nr:alginate lyase family protein [Nitrospiraceae bacterium]